MPLNLYAEPVASPGLGVPLQWRYQNNAAHIVDVLDPESPVCGAINQAIQRYENTVFELAADKKSLVDWATAQHSIEDEAIVIEQRLGAAHVLQQSIELFEDLLRTSSRRQEPLKWAATQHNLGDVLGFIGQRSGTAQLLEQAAAAYETALEEWTEEHTPFEWASSQYNLATVLHILGQLDGNVQRFGQ